MATETPANLSWQPGGGHGRPFTVHQIQLEVPEELLVEPIRNALDEGYYEHNEVAALDRLVRDGDVVLEIGGGLGVVATKAALNSKVRSVSTFEADPRLIPVIKRTLALNGAEARVCGVALVNGAAASTTFVVSTHFWASSRTGYWGGDAITVPTRSFQEELAELRPTLLIVDIEGDEIALFTGIDLGSVERIIMETHPEAVGDDSVAELLSDLSVRGFARDVSSSHGNVVCLIKGQTRRW